MIEDPVRSMFAPYHGLNDYCGVWFRKLYRRCNRANDARSGGMVVFNQTSSMGSVDRLV